MRADGRHHNRPALTSIPLDGGIRLKDRQTLVGVRAAARDGDSLAAGDQHHRQRGMRSRWRTGNEVGVFHIDSPAGSAVFGDNVKGATLRDLLVTRRLADPAGPGWMRPCAASSKPSRAWTTHSRSCVAVPGGK